MKYMLFTTTAVLTMISALSNAQATIGTSSQYPRDGDLMPGSPYGYTYHENLTEPSNVSGYPFLYDEFKPAQIIFIDNESNPVNLNLNYNMYADFMKIEGTNLGNQSIQLLPKALNYDILIEGDRFRFVSFSNEGKSVNSYVEIIESYENGSFLALKRSMKIRKGLNYFKPEFQKTEHFYYINNDGSSFILENHEKRISNNFPDHVKARVEKYIADKNIRFDENLRGLKGVARYYASLN
ncbi:hypothetical protein [Nonlabens marinus]|uniref:Uncharacterized protein n=1 Tax=Nonlabens marinus S1-08 TaxID=1454201 RepID=W8VNU5_9FLAO|nr:hypothetical protein [Nonlabens marinus]BAO54659.1 hypothetical protein NMS_0650 [Nonlabens marinus S1-08]